MHPESSDGAGTLPGPPDEFGVAIPPDERIILSQENGLNSETLHSETDIAILPEEQRQQNFSLNDDPHSMTENGLSGVKEEVGVALLPEERKSDASIINLFSIPSTKSTWTRTFLRIRRLPQVPPHLLPFPLFPTKIPLLAHRMHLIRSYPIPQLERIPSQATVSNSKEFLYRRDSNKN